MLDFYRKLSLSAKLQLRNSMKILMVLTSHDKLRSTGRKTPASSGPAAKVLLDRLAKLGKVLSARPQAVRGPSAIRPKSLIGRRKGGEMSSWVELGSGFGRFLAAKIEFSYGAG
jgi:hypothetical protein